MGSSSAGSVGQLSARWLGKLPYAKRRAIERAPAPAAHATLAGVALLEQAAQALGYEPLDAGRLTFPARGKPGWPGGPEFNISHTGQYVACVAARGLRVGIDIEKLDRVSPNVLRRVASPREWELYGRTMAGASRLWTRKEAVLKAHGSSIFEAPAVSLYDDYADLHGTRWYFAGPDRLEECALAVAVERPGAVVELRRATQLA
jgi:4'-phosphopantetheinyl transferase